MDRVTLIESLKIEMLRLMNEARIKGLPCGDIDAVLGECTRENTELELLKMEEEKRRKRNEILRPH